MNKANYYRIKLFIRALSIALMNKANYYRIKLFIRALSITLWHVRIAFIDCDGCCHHSLGVGTGGI